MVGASNTGRPAINRRNPPNKSVPFGLTKQASPFGVHAEFLTCESRITVISKLNAGTRFEFELPLIERAA